MEPKPKTKGSWMVRFFIVLLGIVLGGLFYSILSFIERDIGAIRGPDWETIRGEFVTAEMDSEREQLLSDVQRLNHKIDTLREQQQTLNSSTRSLQNTINQLLSIQQQSIEKGQAFPPESMKTLNESQSAFLENQKKDQQYTQEIATLIQQRQQQDQALSAVLETIDSQERLAREKQYTLQKKNDLKVAALKFAFLIPVFLAVSFLFMKHRTGAWWPLVWAVFLATFIKIGFVAHECFPARYFKYIAILVLLGIVLRILIYLIQMIISPKRDLLIRQYQEYYDKYICPVCSKPIRIGPLRYLGGLKKKQILTADHKAESELQQPYTCPSCGTNLYDKCDKCGRTRHTLLPYCEHCGAQKGSEITERNSQ